MNETDKRQLVAIGRELGTGTDCAECGVDLLTENGFSIVNETAPDDDGELEVVDAHIYCLGCKPMEE